METSDVIKTRVEVFLKRKEEDEQQHQEMNEHHERMRRQCTEAIGQLKEKYAEETKAKRRETSSLKMMLQKCEKILKMIEETDEYLHVKKDVLLALKRRKDELMKKEAMTSSIQFDVIDHLKQREQVLIKRIEERNGRLGAISEELNDVSATVASIQASLDSLNKPQQLQSAEPKKRVQRKKK